MTPRISSIHHWEKLTPEDGHYFFGYYDRNPWNNSITRHLVLKVDQIQRIPERGESAEIGFLDTAGNYTPQTTTRAWCHQQGSMELFLRHRPECFIYNDFDPEKQKMTARIFEPGKGVAGEYDLPVYAMSPDGKWAACLDFSRIPRRGYSYADAALSPDPHPADPAADGIWLLNLHTGEKRLLASYETMMARHPYGYGLADQRVWLNHVIFNCDSTRVLWLFRQCKANAPFTGVYWKTFLYTAALDGSDVECVLSECQWQAFISHQIWGRTPREILVDANWNGTGHGAVVFDESRRPWISQELSGSHGRMAHMVFSPDGKYILADSYPDQNSCQQLILIDAATGEWEELGVFHHEKTPVVETRCDLHPRWSLDGKYITVDSSHTGKRGVFLLKLN